MFVFCHNDNEILQDENTTFERHFIIPGLKTRIDNQKEKDRENCIIYLDDILGIIIDRDYTQLRKELFYNHRNLGITLIISTTDVRYISTDLRTNIDNLIFTDVEEPIVFTRILKQQSRFSKKLCNEIQAMVDTMNSQSYDIMIYSPESILKFQTYSVKLIE